MMSGWVKMHRQVVENGWLRNPNLWAFWCYCLLRSNHKSTKTMVGYQQISLEAGQFVFGRKQASVDLEMSEQKIRTCIENLIKAKNITIKTTNKYSIITIVNWHTYQDDADQNNQHFNQQLTNNQPTTNHRQECKEVKEVKEGPVVVAKMSNTEKMIRQCVIDKSDLIQKYYPHINIEIEVEEIVSKYKHTHIGPDAWLTVSRWLKHLPKPQQEETQQPSVTEIRKEATKSSIQDYYEKKGISHYAPA